jgi:hypothetical protein
MAAAASVAALQGDARQVHPETTADSLALLDERRVNLSHSRTRTVNQLHALLRDLMAGGAPTSLTPARATAALRGFRPQAGPDRIRVALAKELIADVRRFDEQLAASAKTMTALLDEHGTRLERGRRCRGRGRAERSLRHDSQENQLDGGPTQSPMPATGSGLDGSDIRTHAEIGNVGPDH